MYRAPCRISRRPVAAWPAEEQLLSAIDEQRILFESDLNIAVFVVIDGLAWPKIQFDLDLTAPHFCQGELTRRFDSKQYSHYLQIKHSTVNAGVAAGAERFD